MEIENKRALWTESDVNELLGLLKKDNILSKLDGKTKRSNTIYKVISDALNALNEVKRSNAVSGPSRKSYSHFADPDEIILQLPLNYFQSSLSSCLQADFAFIKFSQVWQLCLSYYEKWSCTV